MSLPILVELAFCSHCGDNPGTKEHTPSALPLETEVEKQEESTVWNGFYDADTHDYVCWKCYDVHYQKKRNTDFRGCYSEMPVTVRSVNGTAIDSNKHSSSDPSSESSPLIDLSKLR